MSPYQVEQSLLGICLAFPNGKDNIPQRVVHELDISRFGDPAHKDIYSAIKVCIDKKIPPNPINVSMTMNGTLASSGGLEYLEMLPRFITDNGITDPSSTPEMVRLVDLYGRVRLIQMSKALKDFTMDTEELQLKIGSMKDPEEYLANIVSEFNRLMYKSQSGYTPISDVVKEWRRQFNRALNKEIVDIVPCGIPNLMKYCIPRPRSFGVLQGPTGQGKTSLATYIGLGVARELLQSGEKGKVSFDTLEQSGVKIIQRMICMLAKVNSLNIAQGNLTKDDIRRIDEAEELVNSLPIICNDDPNLTSSQYKAKAIIENFTEPRILGIADYCELFQDKGETEELRISGIVRNVRSVCAEIGSCELLLVQVNDNSVKNNYGVGGLFSSRYSRSPAHAADWYIELVNYPQLRAAHIDVTVPSNKNENMAYAIIEKNRDYPMGEEPFEWQAEYTLFRDVSLPIGKIYADYQKEDEF